MSSTESTKSHKCQHCNKSFPSKSLLIVHLRIHTGEKLFDCEHCDKSFSRKEKLKRHTQIHTGEKLFCCEYCTKSFSRKENLKNHTRIHTGEKPFCCEYCSKSFFKKFNLKRHTWLHTRKDQYRCKVCEKSFSQRSHLIVHTQVHTGEKPYRCEYCNKLFSRRSNLKRHCRTQHKKEQNNVKFDQFRIKSTYGNSKSTEHTSIDAVKETRYNKMKNAYVSINKIRCNERMMKDTKCQLANKEENKFPATSKEDSLKSSNQSIVTNSVSESCFRKSANSNKQASNSDQLVDPPENVGGDSTQCKARDSSIETESKSIKLKNVNVLIKKFKCSEKMLRLINCNFSNKTASNITRTSKEESSDKSMKTDDAVRNRKSRHFKKEVWKLVSSPEKSFEQSHGTNNSDPEDKLHDPPDNARKVVETNLSARNDAGSPVGDIDVISGDSNPTLDENINDDLYQNEVKMEPDLKLENLTSAQSDNAVDNSDTDINIDDDISVDYVFDLNQLKSESDSKQEDISLSDDDLFTDNENSYDGDSDVHVDFDYDPHKVKIEATFRVEPICMPLPDDDVTGDNSNLLSDHSDASVDYDFDPIQLKLE